VRLVVVVPAYNEEQVLGEALHDLPSTVDGFASVGVLVVDDGSTDRTAEVARAAGATVVRHPTNRGLARAFMTGTREAVRMGADVIVTTDADNQYVAADIVRLVRPILAEGADLVVGTRSIGDIATFSSAKRAMQRLGSSIVRLASNTTVPDAPSGFRAMTVATAQRLDVHNDHTYTLETLIQAGRMGLDVRSVPIRVNGYRRPSRLIRWWPAYVVRSGVNIVRIAILYRPFRFFSISGAVVGACGITLLTSYFDAVADEAGAGTGRGWMLVIGAGLLVVSTQAVVAGLLADSLAANGRVIREVRDRLAQLEADHRR
jgi:glycosyltransferase involved in cell wall biosynthesis